LLEKNEIEPNQVDSSGKTPLHIACQRRHENIAKLLLTYPNININLTDDSKATPLRHACRAGMVSIVRRLLTKPNIDINQADKYLSMPLHYACRRGHTQVVKFLLQQDHIIVSQTDRNGRTPLDNACRGGHEDIAALLLQHNGIFLNQTEQGKNEILWKICSRGYENIVHLLLQHNEITINHDNNNGEILIANVIRNNRIHIAKMLIAKLAQTPQGLQPLKTFTFNEQETCLLELAENCPELLDVLNSVRQHKVKSARAVVASSVQDLNLKNSTAVHEHSFFKNVNQTEAEKNEFEEKLTEKIQFSN